MYRGRGSYCACQGACADGCLRDNRRRPATRQRGRRGPAERLGQGPAQHQMGHDRAVADFCDCRAWRERGGTLVFVGLASDTQFATWLLDHLAGFVLTELADHLMGDIAIGTPRRMIINGFVDGITGRISERLRELCKPQTSAPVSANRRALVATKKTLIEAKIKELGLHFRSCGGSSRQHDEGSFAAGRSAGDRASFGRPVSGGRAATLRIGNK